MLIGLFSDIHGNLDALEKVIEFYSEHKCDLYLCLGDIVGYGPQPDECCNRVREFADYTILGNHDAAVCKRMNYSYYYDAARSVLDYHSRLLSPENMMWLKGLEYSRVYSEYDFAICHGSPINERDFNYIFSLEHARQLMSHFDTLMPITFIGHSHLTKAFALSPDGVRDITSDRHQFKGHEKYIVTVGSVGQPRDTYNEACCTIYDTASKVLTYHRVPYDIVSVARKVFDSEIASNFGKRLFLGI